MRTKFPDQEELLRKFGEWIQLEVAQGDASRHTQRSYLSSTRNFLAWCREHNIDVCKASQNDVKLYRAHLIRSNYKRTTIQTMLAGIRRFFDALQDWNVRLDNPATKVKAKRDLTSRAERIAEKYIRDREAFLNLWKLPDRSTTKGIRDSAILRILCYTGCRVSELCALDLTDIIDSDNPQLLIRGGKGAKRRFVPLGRKELEILSDWVTVRSGLTTKRIQALFLSVDNGRRGYRLGTRGARIVVNQYLRMAGVKEPGRSCHALRHSLATWLLEAGVPTEAIADLLGHSSTATTAVYAKVVNLNRFTPSYVLSQSD